MEDELEDVDDKKREDDMTSTTSSSSILNGGGLEPGGGGHGIVGGSGGGGGVSGELPDVAKPPGIKQPCILIFDSLTGGSRARTFQTIR